MAKRDPLLDHLFIYIGDKAFTLKQLGAAADMRLDKGFQHIIDQGLLGEELKGVPWYEVICSSGLKLEAQPTEEETLLHALHTRWQDAEHQCMELDREGKLTAEDTQAMLKLKRDYDTAKKLSKP
jgi:hypothetical protein